MMPYDNETLEAAAQLLEGMAGNSIYIHAWKAGAKRIRALKVLNTRKQVLNDSLSEISTCVRDRCEV